MSGPGRIWAIVPAAGVGRRMASHIPKQYLKLGERTVLAHTVDRLAADPRVHAIVVAVSEGDEYFVEACADCRAPVIRAPGGRERADSVRNALRHIQQLQMHDEAQLGRDWALVHDAVRPCLALEDLSRLIDTISLGSDGALLAMPTRDTMKRVRDERVVDTVPRDELWHALTPQLYPLQRLLSALDDAARHGVRVTDETQAMERQGWRPHVVQGRADNVKITRPEDLALAAFFLAQSKD